MPNQQYDESFERLNLRRFYISLILGAILSQCWPWPTVGMRIIAGFVGIGIGFGSATVLEHFAVQLHRCPRCRARIGRSPDEFVRWDKIILHCPQCEIDWDLGIPGPKSSPEDRFRDRDDTFLP